MKKKLLFILILFSIILFFECKSSYLQSYFFYKKTKNISYKIEDGEQSIIFPKFGPYDIRYGYTYIPTILNSGKWNIVKQAHWSNELFNIVNTGMFPPYNDNKRGGLEIYDSDNNLIYSAKYPKYQYVSFNQIPEIMIKTLLFIEDHNALKKNKYYNSVININRLSKAITLAILNKIGINMKQFGASTLATQLIKFKHSNKGRTNSLRDKYIQMFSASLLVYLKSRDTIEARKNIILNYINNVPLGSFPGIGEIFGIGDGLNIWFGSNFEKENNILKNCDKDIIKCGESYRKILALFLAQRCPTRLLSGNRNKLFELLNNYLDNLFFEGVISYELKNSSMGRLQFKNKINNFISTKKLISDPVRFYLLNKLAINKTYDLDKFDLIVNSSINKKLYNDLYNKAAIEIKKHKSITGKYLLKNNKQDFILSFLLFEKVGNINYLRAQFDQFPSRFSANDSMKLELGSTAKFRVLVSYLQLIENTFNYLYKHPNYIIHPKDKMTLWVKEWQDKNPGGSSINILNDSMDRKFSGSAGEIFFTNGGIHKFSNFEGKGGGSQTVRSGLINSINLVYIRIMRDIINHISYFGERGRINDLIFSGENKYRTEYINKFIEMEGNIFLSRFYSKYKNDKNPIKTLTNEFLNSSVLPIAVKIKRVSTLFRVANPDASYIQYKKFLYNNKLNFERSEQMYKALYGDFDLQDFGYLTRKHPLELWLVAHMSKNKKSSLKNIFIESKSAKKESYRWLLKDTKIIAQNKRISIILEKEAFLELTKIWNQVGYPFNVFPSLASAIGSSGDRPIALAKLIGIIINEGKLCPMERVKTLRFGKNTPYETVLEPNKKCEQVISSEVAAIVKDALLSVVNNGTAIRIKNTFNIIGGKTGTGDNHLGNKAVSRTGTFVFFIDNKYFGVLTTYVNGKKSSKYSFTSSLPVQILKLLAPTLKNHFNKPITIIKNDVYNE